jgi:hypothetical protein
MSLRTRFLTLSMVLTVGCFPDPPVRGEQDMEDTSGDSSVIPDSAVPPTDSAEPQSGLDTGETTQQDSPTVEDSNQPPETDADVADTDPTDDAPVLTGCGAPESDAEECDDGDPCTVDDRCREGACRGVAREDATTDWSLAFGDLDLVPRDMLIDRSGAPAIWGFVNSGAPGTIEAAAGSVTLAAHGMDRTFVVRALANGSAMNSAVAIHGEFSQEVPEGALRSFDDALDHELVVVFRAESEYRIVTASTDVSAETVMTTCAQVTLRNGERWRSPDLWLVDGHLHFIQASRHDDGLWLLAGVRASEFSLPTPQGPRTYSNPEPDYNWRLGLRLSPNVNDRGVSDVVEFQGVYAVGFQKRPANTIPGFDVVGWLPDELRAEGPNGPVTLEASPTLRLLRYNLVGNLAFANSSDHPALVEPFGNDDFWLEWMDQHRAFGLPRLIPRADGGFFLLMRLVGTRRFGLGVDARALPAPSHPTYVLASYELGGRLAWARTIALTASNDPLELVLDSTVAAQLARADGSFVLGGGITGAIRIERGDGTTTTLTSSDNSRDGYIAMWDRTGNLRFAEVVAAGPGRSWVTALAEGTDHSIYIAGSFEGPTTIGVAASAGRLDAPGHAGFVARLNSAGGLDCR